MPVSPRTLTGMIEAPGAIPATPMPLFVRATIVPATCVPWPATSVTTVVPVISLKGAITAAPARSGWLAV